MIGVPRLLRTFLRYVLTGGTAAIVDAGLFAALAQTDLKPLASAVLSFTAAAVVNFLLSSHFVFATKPAKGRFVAFLLAALVGLAVNSSVTVEAMSRFGLSPLPAKILGIAAAFGLNFLLNLTLVFRHVDRETFPT